MNGHSMFGRAAVRIVASCVRTNINKACLGCEMPADSFNLDMVVDVIDELQIAYTK